MCRPAMGVAIERNRTLRQIRRIRGRRPSEHETKHIARFFIRLQMRFASLFQILARRLCGCLGSIVILQPRRDDRFWHQGCNPFERHENRNSCLERSSLTCFRRFEVSSCRRYRRRFGRERGRLHARKRRACLDARQARRRHLDLRGCFHSPRSDVVGLWHRGDSRHMWGGGKYRSGIRLRRPQADQISCARQYEQSSVSSGKFTASSFETPGLPVTR
jgi:hypothetical protein